MQELTQWISGWNIQEHGWDLRQIGQTLLVAPDTSHWSVGYDLKIDEDKFARQVEEKGVKVLIYKVSDANKTTGEQFYDHAAEFWYVLGGKFKLLRMGYHWLQQSVDPSVAYDFYHAFQQDHPTELPDELDFEEPSITSASDYIWRAQVWLGKSEQTTHKIPVVYTGGGYLGKLRDMLGGMSEFIPKAGFLQHYPLHVALYSRLFPKQFCLSDIRYANFYLPWDEDGWSIWQYSNKADFPYYNDGDVYNGTQWGIPSLSLDMNLIRMSWLSQYLENAPEVVVPTPAPKTEIVYRALYNMQIRAGANTGFPSKGVLPAGETIQALDVGGNDGWIRCEQGWVCKSRNGKMYLEAKEMEP